MPYDLHETNAPAAAAPRAVERPAPGKRAPTDGLRTGVPIVDDGPLCERLPDRNCFLEPDQRRELINVIRARAGIIGANAHAALQDTRIEQLLEQPHGWNALAEFIFYSATGSIIGTIMASVKASAYAKFADDIQATLVNVSRAQRKQLQDMVAGMNTAGKVAKVRFIEMVRDAIGPWQQDISETTSATLDDGGLVALKDGLDPNVATVSYFKARIDDMLARFASQGLDEVGVTTHYRHGELVWLGRGKTRRLIVMEDHAVKHTPQTGGDTKPRDLVQKTGRDGKPVVVDADLEGPVVSLFKERTGRDPFEMDVEAAIATGGFLGRLAGDMVTSSIAGLGGLL